MNEYLEFSKVYDELNAAAGYQKRAEFFEKIFAAHHFAPKSILDLACGTGNITVPLARKGYEMIGLDLSSQMLSCAFDKSLKENLEVLWICADMRDFELYGTVDAAVCSLDGINHLLTPEDVLSCFERVRLFLNPGGIFIFDINTIDKLQCVLGNNAFVYDTGNVFCVWQNAFSEKDMLSRFALSVFEKQGGLFRRFDEEHYEKGYGTDEIESLLRQAGFSGISTYGEFSLKPPKQKAERVFFAAKKSGEEI